MKELDHLYLDLSGINLIEASAGTGKTWAIASLYLRLLMETGLRPEEILVVTYTEAATAELRGRIRARIREAIAVMNGLETEDVFLKHLIQNRNQRSPDPATARDRLEQAITSFDMASVYTIHGFCLRALQDNAVESGSLFDTTLVTEQADLIREIAEDFWRSRFFGDSFQMLPYLLSENLSPAYFQRFLARIPFGPGRDILPQFENRDIPAMEDACLAVYREIQDMWNNRRGEIVEILSTDKGLSRSQKGYRADRLPELFDNMDAFVSAENPFAIFPGFEKFTTETIARLGLKKNPPPRHLFFDRCQSLRQLVESRFLGMRWEWLRFAVERLPEIKRQGNIRFFDDLLTDLYAALTAEDTGKILAQCLRKRYRAGFIDEFQDTDPVQYDIFQAIYSVPETPLFLIGDPKQAIYGFRGADVFAYMEAATRVLPSRRFTLTANWRSDPSLLTAFNTVFSRLESPFLFPDIRYYPVRPGIAANRMPNLESASGNAPFQIRFLCSSTSDSRLTVGQANGVISRMVAKEIDRLLEGQRQPTGEDCRVSPGDIAVIVRTHRQASWIQTALREQGIPVVLRSDISVFQSPEAGEVFTMLRALADPGNERAVRAALLTDLLGRSGNDIAGMAEHEGDWEECLERFRGYHETWRTRGFMVMVRALLSREHVRGRLLARPDGERRLTNLLHCLELIHRKAHEENLGMERLLAWFGERIVTRDTPQEYQIRLDTDENAVKIVTVHVSKGLEYPIVFCPFLWNGIYSDTEVVTCHEGFRMVTDFGSANFDRHRIRAESESLAENIRLMYVALTRARSRCIVYTGKIFNKTGKKNPETSAMSYLFHASDAVFSDADPIRCLINEVKGLSAGEMVEQLKSIEERSDGAVWVEPVEIPENQPGSGMRSPVSGSFPQMDPEPVCREFHRVIATDWQVASFTFFSSRESRAVEFPDRDGDLRPSDPDLEVVRPENYPEKSMFTFPRGTASGIFFHEILEKVDFSVGPSQEIRILVEKGLNKHRYDPEWEPAVTRMIQNVLATRLGSPEGEFSLGALSAGSWVCEMEFFFPLRYITSRGLAASLRKWGGIPDADIHMPALFFKPVQGMVHGFIDMVFEQKGRYYLVDWKSNHLGFRREDYRRPSLEIAMKQHLYPLQYLLYTVALHRYLSQRIPEYDYQKHFGGVFYVFLRGVSSDHGEDSGFFRDRPPAEAIEELSEYLLQIF